MNQKWNSFKKYAPMWVFCIFIGVMLLLFLCLPKQDFSPDEKRVLEAPPQISFQSIKDGSFGKSVESYLSDHFAGRKFFVGFNAYYNLYTGRGGAADVYLGKDNYLINKPVVMKKDNLDKNISRINHFAEQIDVPVSLTVVPSTGYVMDDKLPAVHLPYRDEEILSYLTQTLASSIQYTDLTEPFRAHREEEPLFYRTDHHWTTAGAYLGYESLCSNLGITPVSKDRFTIESHGDFFGTAYSHSGYWMTPPDTIQLWKDSQQNSITVRIEEAGKDPVESHSLYFPSHLEEEDKYPVFLDGNHGYTKITNEDAPEGKLLLIKDSFGHSLVPFLTEHYREIYMIDLRYYKNALTELVQQENIDQVLFLYGLDNMVNDTNFVWLK